MTVHVCFVCEWIKYKVPEIKNYLVPEIFYLTIIGEWLVLHVSIMFWYIFLHMYYAFYIGLLTAMSPKQIADRY